MENIVVVNIPGKVIKKAPKQKHPRGLYVLFMTEFWERFSFYGMRAIFVLFMTDQLFFEKSRASNIYGSYSGLAYLTPIIGGYIADKYWGGRKSIFIGGAMMALGQFILFTCASIDTGSGAQILLLWTGLVFLFTGNGFFKPNISAMVGQLYDEKENTQKDTAYTIFYMGINAGAFLAPLVCGYLGENVDFKWGFFAAGTGMIISLAIFYFTRNKYLVAHSGEPIGMSPAKTTASVEDRIAKEPKSQSSVRRWHMLLFALALPVVFIALVTFWNVDVLGALIYSMTLVIPLTIITDQSLTKAEKSNISVLVIILVFVIFFWMCFEQAGVSLTFFAKEQTDRNVFGWEVPASYFQSLGPIFVVLLAPAFAWLWRKLAPMKIEPPAPRKQALGLIFLSLGFLLIAFGTPVDMGVKVSIFWLTGLYFLHSVGELLVSPIGLSIVNRLTPKRFAALMMGLWFLATATGNKLAGTMSALYPEPCANCPKTQFLGITIDGLQTYFMLFMVLAGVAGIILYCLSFKLSKMMNNAR